MKLLLYTHSDYNWVWKYWHQQTDKYLNNFEKICLLNSQSIFRDDYLVIKYNDQNTYKNRILSCLDKLNDDDVVLFLHEDMFLYNMPKFNIFNEYCDLIKNDKCHTIKLIRAFENLEKSTLHKNLLINPCNQLFSIQPTILKIKTLKQIYSSVPGNNIWEFEDNTSNKYLKDLISLCSFDEKLDFKRGKFHYDSSIFPYICTAVIKGKWNYKEYKKELFEIFYNKKFNHLNYYFSRLSLFKN
tara:strand:+ start:985 stop:1710 length:726 start_codon:yes stop_codon:yes gene_type:complete